MEKQLPCGRSFQYDEVDEDLVSSYSWHVVSGYVQTEVGDRRKGTRKFLRLHRLIMQPDPHELVDHRNRDPFDNRRANLRIANKSTNGMNRGAQANNTSGYKGVSFHVKTGKWRSSITVKKKTKYLGLLLTPELAYAAYCQAAAEIHGEFSCG